MAQQIVDIGTSPDDGTGDQLRAAFEKLNDNFTELYANQDTSYSQTIGDGVTTQFTIPHNLGAAAVDVVVRRAAGTRDRVLTPYSAPDTNTVVVQAFPAPAVNGLLVTVTPVIGA